MNQRSTNDLTELQHQLYEERFYGIPSGYVPAGVIHTFLFSVAVLAIVASRLAFSANSLSETEFEELSVAFSTVAVELNRKDLLTKEYWASDKSDSRTLVSNFVHKDIVTKSLCPGYEPPDSYLVAAFPPQEISLPTIDHYQSVAQIASRKIAAKPRASILAAQPIPAIENISPRRQAATLQIASSWQASRQLANAPELVLAEPGNALATGGAPAGGGSLFPPSLSGGSAFDGPIALAQNLSPLGGSGALPATSSPRSGSNPVANLAGISNQGLRQSVSNASQLATNSVGSALQSLAGPPVGSSPPVTSAVATAPTIRPPSIASAAAPSQPAGLATFDGTDSGQLTQAIDVILDDFHLDGSEVEVPAGTELAFESQLSGTGVFAGGGDVTTNGELSPGNSPGIIGFGGSVTFGSTSTTVIEIAGTNASVPDYDQINVGGNLTISSGATLSVVLLDSFTLTDGMMFNIINVDGSTSGTFAGLAEGALVNSYVSNHAGSDLFITYVSPSMGSNIVLYTTPVPEPLTTIMFATAIGMLACPRRRRK